MSAIPGLLREVRMALRLGLTGAPRATLSLPVTFGPAGVTGTIWSSTDIYAGDELTITGAGPAANRGAFLVHSVTASLLVLHRIPGTLAPLSVEGPTIVTLTVNAPSRRYWEGGPVVETMNGWPYLTDQVVVQSTNRQSIESSTIPLRVAGTWLLNLNYRAGDGTGATDAWAAHCMVRLAPGNRVTSPAGQIVRIRTLVVGASQALKDRTLRPLTLTWWADARSAS